MQPQSVKRRAGGGGDGRLADFECPPRSPDGRYDRDESSTFDFILKSSTTRRDILLDNPQHGSYILSSGAFDSLLSAVRVVQERRIDGMPMKKKKKKKKG
jgi:hypothetical protein